MCNTGVSGRRYQTLRLSEGIVPVEQTRTSAFVNQVLCKMGYQGARYAPSEATA